MQLPDAAGLFGNCSSMLQDIKHNPAAMFRRTFFIIKYLPLYKLARKGNYFFNISFNSDKF
jgi:hypothetical protein